MYKNVCYRINNINLDFTLSIETLICHLKSYMLVFVENPLIIYRNLAQIKSHDMATILSLAEYAADDVDDEERAR